MTAEQKRDLESGVTFQSSKRANVKVRRGPTEGETK